MAKLSKENNITKRPSKEILELTDLIVPTTELRLAQFVDASTKLLRAKSLYDRNGAVRELRILIDSYWDWEKRI